MALLGRWQAGRGCRFLETNGCGSGTKHSRFATDPTAFNAAKPIGHVPTVRFSVASSLHSALAQFQHYGQVVASADCLRHFLLVYAIAVWRKVSWSFWRANWS
jgi:hypothetical protein